MILFMKKHIEKTLIVLGVVLLALFIVYTQKNNIPTQNTWAAFIGLALFNFLFLPGAWIASEKMKEKSRTFSLIIKGFTILVSISFVGSFIVFLFNL